MKPNTNSSQLKLATSFGRSILLTLLIPVAGSLCSAVTLQWDNTPATPGIQDGAGNWSNLSSLANWWDGSQNVAWTPGATAILGAGLTANATITLTNPIVAEGLVFANSFTVTNSSVPVYTIASGNAKTNLTLMGSPANVILANAYNNPYELVGVSGGATISASVIASNGVKVMATSSFQEQVSFNNTTNYINGSMEIGTPGNADYSTPTALQAQFNSGGINAGALNGCTNMTIHKNSGVLIRGVSSAYTLPWPKKFFIEGDGIPNSFFCFGAINFAGYNGCVFPADIQLNGDSTVILTWGNNNAVVTNTGTISGTGRLRLNQSANRPTTGSKLVLKGTNTYSGDTIIDGGLVVQLASGATNRIPSGTQLQLGSSGLNYAPNANGVPQSSYNGYGGLVLGDANGVGYQTLAGVACDTTYGAQSYISGGNSSANSLLTLNNSSDVTFTGTLGGTVSPNNRLGLVKTSVGTLYLNGTNGCLGGYLVNAGALVFGDGLMDYPVSGPLTNNATVMMNVANSLVFGDSINGNGTLIKGGVGSLALTGTNNGAGSLNIQSGTLILNTSSRMDNVSASLASGSTLQINHPVSGAMTNLGMANLTCDNATLQLDMISGVANGALLVVSGKLVNSGSSSINLIIAGLNVGSYPLIKYNVYQSNAASAFVLVPVPGITASIRNNPSNKSIDLVVTGVTGSTLKWRGNADNSWDLSAANWVNPSLSSVVYHRADMVTFDDSATGSTSIAVAADLAPASILVSNISKSYTFSGSGITGVSALIKKGSGSLVVAVSNSNFGGTLIESGTLQVGDGAVDGFITSPIINNGIVSFNPATSNTFGGISGSGSILKTGPGVLTMNSDSSYTGTTTVQQGSLHVQSSGALGVTNSTVVQPGAELWIDGSGLSITNPLSIGGSGISGSGGALNVSSVNGVCYGPLTLSQDAGVYAQTAASITLAGPISGGTRALLIKPQSSSTVTLQSNVTARAINVEGAGAVRLGGSNSVTSITVNGVGNGVIAYNSYALGQNSVVSLTNETTTGLNYSTLTLVSNTVIPSSVAMNIKLATGSANRYRAALHFGTGSDISNVWNGPITITAPDSGTGIGSFFYLWSDSGIAYCNGNITASAGGLANLQLRGDGPTNSGVINGSINIGTNWFTTSALNPWTINTNHNTWGETHIYNGRLCVGVNNGLPIDTTVYLHDQGSHNSTLDLVGCAQQIAGLGALEGTPNVNEKIVNSSTNSPSTLVYQGGVSLFPCRFSSYDTNSQALNLDIAAGTLILTNMDNDYTGITTIRSGATLALAGAAVLSKTPSIEVQSGGLLDLSTSSKALILGAGQVLKGSGTIQGSVTVNGGLAPGSEAIGSISVNGNFTNGASGTVSIRLNKNLGTCDQISCSGAVSYGGLLSVNNMAGTLAAGNSFNLFTGASGATGNFSAIAGNPGPGLGYTFNPATGTLTVVATIAQNPTNITCVVNGNTLALSWPADHAGWILQAQTNSLSKGLTTNWYDVAGTDSANHLSISVNPLSPTVFYRLRRP